MSVYYYYIIIIIITCKPSLVRIDARNFELSW